MAMKVFWCNLELVCSEMDTVRFIASGAAGGGDTMEIEVPKLGQL